MLILSHSLSLATSGPNHESVFVSVRAKCKHLWVYPKLSWGEPSPGVCAMDSSAGAVDIVEPRTLERGTASLAGGRFLYSKDLGPYGCRSQPLGASHEDHEAIVLHQSASTHP